MSFPLISIGDAARVQSGFAFKSADWRDSGIPVVRIKNLKAGWLDLSGCAYVSPEIAEAARSYRLRRGDLLITMTGEIGERALVRSDDELLLNQRVGRFAMTRPDRLDCHYLYYVLALESVRSHLRQVAHGVAQPNISPSAIMGCFIPCPTLPVQRRIVSILSAFNDLIENNTRRIAILEDMSRRLFEEWFMRRRAPPEFADAGAWIDATVGDAFTLQRGFDLPTSERADGPYPVVAASGIHGFHREYKVRGPGVTTGRSGTIGQFQYIENDFWPLNTSLWVKEFKHGGPIFAYYLLSSLDLTGKNTGAAVPSLNRNIVHAMPAVLAPLALTSVFEGVAGEMRRTIATLADSNSNLRTTRDLLLPKLMSGEIEVRAAEEALETDAA